MSGGGLAALSRVVAIVLIGTGLAAIASLADVRQLAFLAGVIAIFIGGVFVLASNQATWLPTSRRAEPAPAPTDTANAPSGMLGVGYGIAVVVGLLGGGLLIGSAIDSPALGLILGLWGLAMLLLGRR
jgi:hypothetical protein